jgi:two-component system chemotaxis response regulator CheY
MSSIKLSELSIFLVEPSATQRKIIVSHLKKAGVYNIEGFASGSDALKTIRQYPPDLVISALHLPDMTADKLILLTRDIKSETQVHFMLISSETRFTQLDDVKQAGIVAILPKPFDHNDLKKALETTIDFMEPDELQLDHYDVSELRVLVVDDSSTARNHISRVLNNLGIEKIIKAIDGVSAVNIVKENNFELIITDLNMPNMDGKQLVEYIRNDLNNTITPIIMVTSDNDEGRLDEVRQAGVTDICDKPFEPESIRRLLTQVFSN